MRTNISITSPNLIITDNLTDCNLNFTVSNEISNLSNIFTVSLISNNRDNIIEFKISNNFTFIPNQLYYNLLLTSSIFDISSFVVIDDTYSLNIYSDNIKYISKKYINITKNGPNIKFKINQNNLDYNIDNSNNLLISAFVSGLTKNSDFNLKLGDIISPNIKFNNDGIYYHTFNKVNLSNVELLYNSIKIMDNSTDIISDNSNFSKIISPNTSYTGLECEYTFDLTKWNSILMKHSKEYCLNLRNSISYMHIYTANNPDNNNLTYYKSLKVTKNRKGFYLLLKTTFNLTGELHFYMRDNVNPVHSVINEYIGSINITHYPVNLTYYNNKIIIDSPISINSFNIYSVDDINGSNPTNFTRINNLNNSIDVSNFNTRYIKIFGKNNAFLVNSVIEINSQLASPVINLNSQLASPVINLNSQLASPVINLNSQLASPVINLNSQLASPNVFSINPNIASITDNNNNPVDSSITDAIPENNLRLAAPATFAFSDPSTTIIGVYTHFDNAYTTPSYFLETYGLYTYINSSTLDPSYTNFDGYLVIQPDPLSNAISQTNGTLDLFVSQILGQLANKNINVINVPIIFQSTLFNNNFTGVTHTFEYYNYAVLNNQNINIQAPLCLYTQSENKLLTSTTQIQNNFLLAYNNEIRNYDGQNAVNEQITAVSNLTSNNPRYAWIEDLGKYISQYYELAINTTTIERITNDFMNILGDTSVPKGKKSGLYKMIGNVPELTAFNSNPLPKYELNIPIPFYFNRFGNAGLSIPMIALLHSDVKLTIQMEQLQNLLISDPLTTFTTSNRPKLSLQLKYIYLDNEERIKFARSKHEYLIEQENYRDYTHVGTQFKAKINLSNPVKNLYWFAQPLINIANKQYFNYTISKFYRLLSNYDRSDEVNPITIFSRKFYATLYAKNPEIPYIPVVLNDIVTKYPIQDKSPINNSELRINGQQRFNSTIDQTTLVNFLPFLNIPMNGLHVYTFSRHPEQYQPSGSCNFSILDDTYFTLDTDNGSYSVKFIATNYNLLRIMGGQAGLAFEI